MGIADEAVGVGKRRFPRIALLLPPREARMAALIGVPEFVCPVPVGIAGVGVPGVRVVGLTHSARAASDLTEDTGVPVIVSAAAHEALTLLVVDQPKVVGARIGPRGDLPVPQSDQLNI